MKYIVSLNGKDYEVEVEQGEAILVSVSDTPAAAPVAAPAAPPRRRPPLLPRPLPLRLQLPPRRAGRLSRPPCPETSSPSR